MPKRIDVTDLRGWGRLAFDATLGVTAVVEGMHHNIGRGPWFLDAPKAARTRGLTGLVYGSVRGVTRLVGKGYDLAVSRLAGPDERAASPQREAVLGVLNGVLGDHLVATGNPLAVPMAFRRDAQRLTLERRALAAAVPGATSKLLVLVHGLCWSDLRWQRQGHDHGKALERDLGYTPVYLRYNSGLHVSTNGREFSEALEHLVEAWPVPVEDLSIVGYSMGGLLTRSACHEAERTGRAWRRHLKNVVFLGTPHHGAALERGGNWVDVILGISPYTAPLSQLGRLRSAGITDLRHGNLLEDDWHGRDRFARSRDVRCRVPLPEGVRCFTIGGTTSRVDHVATRLLGDGIVPLESALGGHREPARNLDFPVDRRWVAQGVNHLDLLSDAGVYERVRTWLAS